MLEIDVKEFKKNISEKIKLAYLNKDFLITKEEPIDMGIQQILGELFITDLIGIYEGRIESFEITVVREGSVIIVIANTEAGESLLEVLLSVVENDKGDMLTIKNVITSIKHIQ